MRAPESYSVRDLIPKVAPFVRPFLGLVALSFLANLVFSLMDAAVLAIVDPVFRTLFGGESPDVPTPTSQVSFGLKEQFDSFIYTVVLAEDFFDSIRNLSIFIFILFLIRSVAKYLGRIIGTRIEEGMMKSIRDALFLHVSTLSMDFFAKKKTGDIMSLLTNDVGVLNSATISSITRLWKEGTSVLIFMILLFSISAKLTLIALAVSLVGLLLIRTATGILRRYGARMQKAQANYTSTLQESILGIRVLKALGVESSMVKRFTDETGHFVRMSLRNVRISALVPVVNDTFGILALVGVFFAGGVALAAGEIAPSSLVTFLFLLFGLMGPITAIVSTITGMQRGVAAGANIAATLDEHPTIVDGEEAVTSFESALSVNDVSFDYGEGHVLHNVTLSIQRGETVALVGASGSGKSTMLDLLLRLYDPTTGSVTVDGRDIRTLQEQSYRRLFGMVSQETILFNDTVTNNIRLGEDALSMDQVRKAATIAHADPFIRQLPQGYDTVVGDRGTRLSGGQRQRLAIARALVREPEILLFDEATSALDTESERIVQEAISEVLADRTAVIVAHRLSTIVNADRIVVFEDGRIVEEGRHDELLKHDGVYAKLHAMQFSA